MNIVITLLQYTFISFIPILIVALGGLMSEKSGVTNIALEGIMLMGAFIGIWMIKILQETTGLNPQLIYLIGMIVGGVVGLIFSAIHAFASIHMNADQTISATALNLFAPAFAIFTARSIMGGQQVKFTGNFLIQKVPLLGDIPFIGDILFQKTYLSFYLGLLIFVIVLVLMYKTRLGLRIRAVGENPHAAQSLGIHVKRIRYFSVLSSGFLAGLGGVVFVATTSEGFDATVAGLGFLSIAVLIFGNWKPQTIIFAALFFGFFRTFVNATAVIPWLADAKVPDEFFQMLPYIVTLVALAFTSKRSLAPKAIGQPFDQGQR
ncbi:ABC transporter permease [Acholeplasma equifetale]|uniref:ABC transporter permease n=1 Tax=Acholeplasma equifetale TaxID=264634 RepID=UPI00047C36FD|nr:ABC transporter permease [Acholeplasma equifetale]